MGFIDYILSYLLPPRFFTTLFSNVGRKSPTVTEAKTYKIKDTIEENWVLPNYSEKPITVMHYDYIDDAVTACSDEEILLYRIPVTSLYMMKTSTNLSDIAIQIRIKRYTTYIMIYKITECIF